MKLFDKIFRRDAAQYEAGRAAMEKGATPCGACAGIPWR